MYIHIHTIMHTLTTHSPFPSRPKLQIVLWSSDGTELENITLTKLSHLSDYSQPHAPGALLKAAFICAGVVQYPSSVSLEQQLMERFGCGFKLQSFSNVPRGSGMYLLSYNYLPLLSSPSCPHSYMQVWVQVVSLVVVIWLPSTELWEKNTIVTHSYMP